MSSRPGVEAVSDRSSVMCRTHNEPQQKLYTRLPVSTGDCPAGGCISTHTHKHIYGAAMALCLTVLCILRTVCVCGSLTVAVTLMESSTNQETLSRQTATTGE